MPDTTVATTANPGSSGAIDSDFMQRLRQALKDPSQRAIIRNELNQTPVTATGAIPNSGQQAATGPNMNTAMQQAGQNIAKAPNTQTAVAGGAGTLAGTGLAALIQRLRSPGSQQGQMMGSESRARAAAGPPAGNVMAGANAPPSVSQVVNQPTVPGQAQSPYIGTDANGNPIIVGSDGVSQSVFRKGGSVRGKRFAEGGAEDLPEPEAKEPKGVLLRRAPMTPMHPPVHTTVVIALTKPKGGEGKTDKAKPKKKKRGGAIAAKKPAAIPPKKGPGNGDGPASPFRKGGHVQVPRGSGCAQRGKSFAGIY